MRIIHLCRTAVLASVLIGCVSSGTINGRLTVPGKPGVPTTFVWKSDRFGEGGTLNATLPSGEQFVGRYLQISSVHSAESVTPFFIGWAPGWDDWGPYGDPWLRGGDTTTFVRNYTGKVVATLFGSDNETMRCRFRLADPEAGMSGGGLGECQVSNGAKIAAQF